MNKSGLYYNGESELFRPSFSYPLNLGCDFGGIVAEKKQQYRQNRVLSIVFTKA
tara:strand:- start:24 stop:185 length:162 start_codon:yes stop_codon:yes gene_type:complete